MEVLKNCEPELLYMLAELFNMCLKESCFPDCWKVSSVVSVFRNADERFTATNYQPVSLLLAVRKIFVNSRPIDDHEKHDISRMASSLPNQLMVF